MYREPHVASRVSGHHASPRGDAARDIQNATRPIYNKARGAEDGTPTSAFSFHKGQAHTCTHMSHPQTPASGSGHRSRVIARNVPKHRNAANRPTAHTTHQPRRAPTHSPPHPGELLALPLIGLCWCAVAAAQEHTFTLYNYSHCCVAGRLLHAGTGKPRDTHASELTDSQTQTWNDPEDTRSVPRCVSRLPR